MKKRRVLRFVTFLVFTGVLTGGLVGSTVSGSESSGAPVVAGEKQEANVYKGQIAGVSEKAKSITITVGKGDKEKMVMVKFDENTKGMEFAKKGEAAIIKFEERGGEKFATVVQPKLAELPAGVSEMQPEELIGLVALGPEKGGYFLVDSRPAKRFAEGHIPSSVSIPVELLEEKGAELLPADKTLSLIFHCGGVT